MCQRLQLQGDLRLTSKLTMLVSIAALAMKWFLAHSSQLILCICRRAATAVTAVPASHAQAARLLAAAPARRGAVTAARSVTADQTVGVPSAQALARPKQLVCRPMCALAACQATFALSIPEMLSWMRRLQRWKDLEELEETMLPLHLPHICMSNAEQPG